MAPATDIIGAGQPGRRPPDRLLAQTRLELARMRDRFGRMRNLAG